MMAEQVGSFRASHKRREVFRPESAKEMLRNPIDVQILTHFDAKRNDSIVSSAVEGRLVNACVIVLFSTQ